MQWGSDLLLCQQGLKTAPDNPTVKDNLGNVFANQAMYDRAIPLYLEVVQRTPGFWRSNYNLGYSYYKLGNLAEAERWLSRAVAMNRDDADEFIYLALTEMRLGKLAEAANAARRAVEINPAGGGFHLTLGVILQAQGHTAEALEELRQELRFHPENQQAWSALERIEGQNAPAGPRMGSAGQ